MSSKQAEKKKKTRPRKKNDRVTMKNQMDIDHALAEPVEVQTGTAGSVTEPDASEKSGRAIAKSDEHVPKDIEMVDELAESMRNLRIPKTLSFGRKQRGRR